MRNSSRNIAPATFLSAFLLLVAVVVAISAIPTGRAQTSKPAPGLGNATFLKRVPYVPTPPDIVEKMLDLAKVTPDDVVYDLGSGDGRIVITAAQKYKAHAVGIEINADLYRQSRDRIKELGLDDRAKVMCEDMFDVSLHHATVVVMYLLTANNEKLRPKLERELHSGTRIVCHDFHIPGWDPEQVMDVTSRNGIPHKLYIYVRP